MKINRHNYEEYLLDFIEGNLSEAEAIAVNSFLDKNPDLKAEAEQLLDCNLNPESFHFNNKAALKKDLTTDIEGITKFEQLSIAFLENDISEEEQQQLDTMLKKSDLKQHEHQILQNTKLNADLDVVFPYKSRLKQYHLNNIGRKKFYVAVSMAASITLLAGIIFFGSENNNRYALAFENNHSKLNVSRYYIEKEAINTFTEIKINRTNHKSEEIIIDTPIYNRESSAIALINIKKAPQLKLNNIAAGKISTEIYAELATATASTDENDVKVEDYVNQKLYELGVEQENEKKSLIATAGKSVAQFIGKIFKKNIQVEKKEIEDGRKLYAVRAGSLEFYTSIKNRKQSNQKEISNGE